MNNSVLWNLRAQRYWISVFALLVGDNITKSLTSGTGLHGVLKMNQTHMYESFLTITGSVVFMFDACSHFKLFRSSIL